MSGEGTLSCQIASATRSTVSGLMANTTPVMSTITARAAWHRASSATAPRIALAVEPINTPATAIFRMPETITALRTVSMGCFPSPYSSSQCSPAPVPMT
jgi:hypothetical protein